MVAFRWFGGSDRHTSNQLWNLAAERRSRLFGGRGEMEGLFIGEIHHGEINHMTGD